MPRADIGGNLRRKVGKRSSINTIKEINKFIQ
jgi:hypothetical protein